MRFITLVRQSSSCLILLVLYFGLVPESKCGVAAEAVERERELGTIKPKQLDEISGLAASRKNSDVVWVHNDGKSPYVFAVLTSGELAAVVSLPVKIVDFEDVAIGPGPKTDTDYLYLGDIGDNKEQRREISIVRFAEPQLPQERGSQIEVEAPEVFSLVYPDGAHNAEALIVDPANGDLYIVTKDKQNSRLFSCPASALKDKAIASLKPLGTLNVGEVSGGAISPDGDSIILRRETQGWLWKRGKDQIIAAALQLPFQEIPVLGSRQGPNGEAVSFSPDGRSYYTVSEGKKQVLCNFQLPPTAAEPTR